MGLVRIRSLQPGCEFETALTHRMGVVTKRTSEGILVLLEPLSGDELEEKLVAPEVLVRFAGFESRAALRGAA